MVKLALHFALGLAVALACDGILAAVL